MKIELDLPVPDGWRFVGVRVPNIGQGFVNYLEVFEVNTGQLGNVAKFLTFERIEQVDEELEAMKAKFPANSYFKINDSFSPIFKVAKSDIERDSRFPEVINIPTYDGNNFIWFNSRICTPFPIPVWRCCETDKPKKNGYYYTRDKRDNSKRYGFYNFNHYDNSNYEWLDEGER